MFEFRQRKRWKKIANSKVLFVVLMLVVFVLGRAAFNVYGKYAEASQNLSRSTKELAALQERQSDLSAAVARLKTPSGVEEEIRQKFQVTKEGEHLIVIVDPKGLDGKGSGTTTKSSFFDSIKNFFGF